jgi:hypothetical protein
MLSQQTFYMYLSMLGMYHILDRLIRSIYLILKSVLVDWDILQIKYQAGINTLIIRLSLTSSSSCDFKVWYQQIPILVWYFMKAFIFIEMADFIWNFFCCILGIFKKKKSQGKIIELRWI